MAWAKRVRELLDLAARRRLGEQVRNVALEELEQALAAALGEQRGEAGADALALPLERGVEALDRASSPPRTPMARARRSRGALPRPAGGASAARPPSAAGSRPGAGSRRRRAARRTAPRGRTPTWASARQRALGRTVAHLRDAAAVQELQRLGDELDVADAAGADLDVERRRGAALGLLDLLLHRA